jgi:hypothetical protein
MRTSSSVPFVELGTYRMQVTKGAIGGFQVDRLTASFNPRAADPRAASAEAVARSHLGLGNAGALRGSALSTFKLKAGQSRATCQVAGLQVTGSLLAPRPSGFRVRALRPTSDGRRARHFRPVNPSCPLLSLSLGHWQVQVPASWLARSGRSGLGTLQCRLVPRLQVGFESSGTRARVTDSEEPKR